MVEAWPAIGTATWFGRDLAIFSDVLDILREEKSSPVPSIPPRVEILYPIDFIPEENAEQVKAMNNFIRDITKSTGCTSRHISIGEDWLFSGPVQEKDLNQYLFNVIFPPNSTTKFETRY